MRKFLLNIVFLFSFLTSLCQTNYTFNSSEYGVWKVSGQAICGVGNAYCTVYRSGTPNSYGNYVYTIYFSTNSYFNNCEVSRTYIPDIYVYYYDKYTKKYYYPSNYYPFWITVGQTSLAYTLYHNDPYLKLWIKVGKMEPTNY